MSHFDFATYNVAGITLVSDGYDERFNITYYRTREFLNPKDDKYMYLRVGRSVDTHEWTSCELYYAGADHPIRTTTSIYDDEDLKAFIADVERDELDKHSIRKLLE